MLELERRFFGNTGEETYDELGIDCPPLMLKKREKAVLALDIRTLYDADIMCQDDWDGAKDALKEFYIDFYVNARAYLRKKSNLQSKHSNKPIVPSTTTTSTSVSKEPDKVSNI